MATQTGSSFGYYFNATWLGGSTYLSIFDAEKWKWQETGDATGDSSAAVKIVADPTAFGAFGTHVANQNILIGRSAASAYMGHGASNPALIYGGNSNTWGVYWVNVIQDPVDGQWRDTLMLAMVASGDPAQDILAANMLYHAQPDPNVGGVDSNQWAFPRAPGQGALVEQPIGSTMLDVKPVLDLSNAPIQSAYGSSGSNGVNGLIGSFTTENSDSPGAGNRQYFYYTDKPAACPAGCLLRRRVLSEYLTRLDAPEVVLDFANLAPGAGPGPVPPYMQVHYLRDAQGRPELGRYLVAYYCSDHRTPGAVYYDVCIQTAPGTKAGIASLASTMNFNDDTTYGLYLSNDPGIPKDGNLNFSINQFGFKLDGWGNLMAADGRSPVTIYLPVTPHPNDLWPFDGVGIYARTLTAIQ